MFCPNCGTQPPVSDQKFCKTCGTNLAAVSQVLSMPAAPPASLHTPPAAMHFPGPISGPPAVQSPMNLPPQVHYAEPIPLSAIASLPFMEQEAKRQQLRKIGWSMVLGGPLIVPIIAILGGVLHFHPELCVIGIPVLLIGLFLLLFARIVYRKPDMPPVIVVQQPASGQGITSGMPQAPPSVVQPQLPPPAAPSFYTPGSLTEHTTRNLQQTPYSPPPRDTR